MDRPKMVEVTPTLPNCALRRDNRTTRGATMVEFAVVSFALFTLIFGIIEGALAVRAHNAVSNAADDAARKGAVASTRDDVDYVILRQLLGRGADSAADVEYVVVYKPEAGDAGPNAACKAGTAVADVCNVYHPAEFSTPASSFDCSSPALDGSWCPELRLERGEIGFVGVYIRAKYVPVTGGLVFDVSLDVSADSRQAIESSGEL